MKYRMVIDIQYESDDSLAEEQEAMADVKYISQVAEAFQDRMYDMWFSVERNTEDDPA